MADLPEDRIRSMRGYVVRADGPLARKLAGLSARPVRSEPAATPAAAVPEPMRGEPAGPEIEPEPAPAPASWPTADLVAAVVVAVCRVVGSDPIKMMRGQYPHHHPGRVYVFHALRREFPRLDDATLARLTGIKFGSWGVYGRKMGKFGPTSERLKYGIWNRRAEDAARLAIGEFKNG